MGIGKDEKRMAEWATNFSDLFYKCFIREDRYKLLLSGIGVTIKVSLLAIVIGILIGMVIATCNLSTLSHADKSSDVKFDGYA